MVKKGTKEPKEHNLANLGNNGINGVNGNQSKGIIMANYSYTYANGMSSIRPILQDQREMELNPIITATERANLEASRAVAEFQSNLVKNQVKNFERQDRNALKQQYAENIKIMASLPAGNPMINILEAENQDIINQLK